MLEYQEEKIRDNNGKVVPTKKYTLVVASEGDEPFTMTMRPARRSDGDILKNYVIYLRSVNEEIVIDGDGVIEE